MPTLILSFFLFDIDRDICFHFFFHIFLSFNFLFAYIISRTNTVYFPVPPITSSCSLHHPHPTRPSQLFYCGCHFSSSGQNRRESVGDWIGEELPSIFLFSGCMCVFNFSSVSHSVNQNSSNFSRKLFLSSLSKFAPSNSRRPSLSIFPFLSFPINTADFFSSIYCTWIFSLFFFIFFLTSADFFLRLQPNCIYFLAILLLQLFHFFLSYNYRFLSFLLLQINIFPFLLLQTLFFFLTTIDFFLSLITCSLSFYFSFFKHLFLSFILIFPKHFFIIIVACLHSFFSSFFLFQLARFLFVLLFCTVLPNNCSLFFFLSPNYGYFVFFSVLFPTTAASFSIFFNVCYYCKFGLSKAENRKIIENVRVNYLWIILPMTPNSCVCIDEDLHFYLVICGISCIFLNVSLYVSIH
ncbi:unnamed protein product [Acanthosepion pharaonis]|uniref:Uncharacterized protein n=1 Tax=Acanthosepion pharaonis TaxID=158019 RepID=A0A812BTU6_ACAPH|nr:unnamed protein product [Sepia pharaonis]